jgi:predicted NUDIX family NTP pyrophosphohydrolase
VPKLSAGLVVFRVDPDAGLQVLLVHPGGPFWARKDAGTWSIPKGEYREGDSAPECAEREFTEELGTSPPGGPRHDLGEVVQAGGKRVRAWAVRGDVDTERVVSNTFEIEWPRGSGIRRTFPEVDRAQWFTLEQARNKLLAGQRPLLDRLDQLVRAER